MKRQYKYKNFQHHNLASGHWRDFSLIEQLANIGSEVERSIKWRSKGDNETSKNAFIRALELFDLTIGDPKNKNRLKEVCRARELFCDFFIGTNQYHQIAKQWCDYFYQFAYLAQNRKNL
ncbi:MAG: hypothetical protein V1858_03480 [Candidatus Gottesmanbacteria bacterium]